MAGRTWDDFIFILVPFSALRARDHLIKPICFCSILLRKTGKSQWLERRVTWNQENLFRGTCHRLLHRGLMMD